MAKVRWHLCLSFLGVAACAALFTAGYRLISRELTPVGYGMHTLRAGDTSLAMIKAAGFDWVAQVFSWREIEPVKGQYYWEYPDTVVRAACYYGLHLIARVDHQPSWANPSMPNAPPQDIGDYARFLNRLAKRYKGYIAAYIVWNEPNLAVEWGGLPPDPQGYAALLKAAYPAIKDADPHALVVSAGLAPTNENSAQAMDDRRYLRALYEAGAKRYFDVLGAHPYGFGHPPDDPWGAHDGLNFARLLDWRQIMVENQDQHKPIWATEFGWTLNPESGQKVNEEMQAFYLRRAFERARQEWPWMGVMVIWNLTDKVDAEAGMGWYSIAGEGYSPRQAYKVLAAMPKGWSLPAWRRELQRRLFSPDCGAVGAPRP